MMQPVRDFAVNEMLRAAVGHGVDGAVAWPATPPSQEVFGRVLDIAMEDRLLGALAEAVADGVLVLSPEQLERLTEHHAASQGHMLELERMLLRAAAKFDDARIDFRVLKGVALAHLVYADPAWRTAADLDLLIPSGQLDAAVALAVDELGGAQSVPELRPGFDREFGKESLIQIGQNELDLHRTFVAGPFGLTIELDELFRDSTEIAVGGRRLLALGAEQQFLHACYNVALGDYPVRLGSVRDLLLCREQQALDLDRVVEIARRWRGSAVVQRASQLVIETAGPGAAGDFSDLAALVVPRRETWLLRSYLTPARSYSRPLASVAVIPGVRARVRYARAVLAPSRTYLRSRGWTGRSHVRRAFDRLSTHD